MKETFTDIRDGLEIARRYGLESLFKRIHLSYKRRAWEELAQVIPRNIKSLTVESEPKSLAREAVPAYDLIIPVFNSFCKLQNLLNSLLKHRPDHVSSIVISDDCSTDKRVSNLLLEFSRCEPRTQIITQKKNLGFSLNTTVALKACTQSICVVLNSDTEVGFGSLDRLVAHFLTNPKLATICPLSNHAAYAGIAPRSQLHEFTQAEVLMADLLLQFVQPGSYAVPFSSGFCWAIRRDLFFNSGGFADEFHAGYGEDADYCLRAWMAGYECRVATNVAVFHKGSSSFGIQQANYLSRRHSTLLLKKHPIYLELVSNDKLLANANLQRRKTFSDI
ncbi:glycosyltransferase, partial [Alphaproteobacteria bacterium]|nr:glycosyltransferase [Alphaproteobacteria bacterium]